MGNLHPPLLHSCKFTFFHSSPPRYYFVIATGQALMTASGLAKPASLGSSQMPSPPGFYFAWNTPKSRGFPLHLLFLNSFLVSHLHLWIRLNSSCHNPSGCQDSPIWSPHSISAWVFLVSSCLSNRNRLGSIFQWQFGNNSAKCILIQKYIVKLSLNKQMSHFKILLP